MFDTIFSVTGSIPLSKETVYSKQLSVGLESNKIAIRGDEKMKPMEFSIQTVLFFF